MRVITRFGFGEADRYGDGPLVEVKLDEPWLHEHSMKLHRRDEVFLWSDWATVRVLNVEGAGFFSNIRCHPTREDAERQLRGAGPPNETTFFLDLTTGEAEVNRRLGLSARKFLLLNPWLDRWARERTWLPTRLDRAVRLFTRRRDRLVGGTGIFCPLLLDVREQPKARLLWFTLLVEGNLEGPIFERKLLEPAEV